MVNFKSNITWTFNLAGEGDDYEAPIQATMEEARTMMPLRHPNVLELLALAVEEEDEENLQFMLLTPFMANGELGAYLRSNREPRSRVSYTSTHLCVNLSM